MESLQELARQSRLSLEDMVRLQEALLRTGYMTPERALQALRWFTVDLGIDEYYFRTMPVEDIAKHLIAIVASQLVSQQGGEGVGIQLMNESPDRAVYIVQEDEARTEEVETRIEQRYATFRLSSYLTKDPSGKNYLRLYILTRPAFPKRKDESRPPVFTEVVNQEFVEQSEAVTVERYRRAWEAMGRSEAPYVLIGDKTGTNETRIMVGIHEHRKRMFLVSFGHILNKYNLHSNRKYIEPFADGKRIYSFYFDRLERDTAEEFARDFGVAVNLPDHALTELYTREIFPAQQTLYAIAAASFAQQFLTALTEEYATLSSALKDQPEARGILDTIKMRLVKDTYSESRIARTVTEHPDIVLMLYQHFSALLHPARYDEKSAAESEQEIATKLSADIPSEHDRAIFRSFLQFNRSILRTNFFSRQKTCVGFRLDPAFLSSADFPERPFGIYFLVGRSFVGFHIRFRDIARGGIRIITSSNANAYEKNLDTLFIENYNLALTQQKKNKDIPEGGAKGTILLHRRSQDEHIDAFRSFIDGLLELMTPGDEVHDRLGHHEILFLGPDEHTAELMNWAAVYARDRRYPYWKAFTTGKRPSLGGVPHDTYGMTTAGIHEYVVGVLDKLGLRESEITKIQTGGPDGDLGSNEILLSRDRTLCVIDGSGVLFDPKGLDRRELKRIARKRVMAREYQRGLLSSRGFFVDVADKKVKLPDGTFVPNGEELRNEFHLHPLARADLFVPCGGRPGAVNINNWRNLLDRDGTPKFRIIIEGANLFITEDARLRLEEHGVVVIKDASTNKGGVTSSSLEVLASLALSDREYDKHMRVTDGGIPEFRTRYIKDILTTIRQNARAEFDLLWRERERTGLPFTTLTNAASEKINAITDAIFSSSLVKDPTLRARVVSDYTPPSLLALVGLKKILERVPQNYLNAIIATRMATRFVYGHDLDTNEVDFLSFVDTLAGRGARR
jgi:glutamate dehydrogenase